MTYDQWKTTPPWDQGDYLCADCDAVVASPGDRCPDCEDERIAEEALMAFYEWEPECLDEIDARCGSEQRERVANTPPSSPQSR